MPANLVYFDEPGCLVRYNYITLKVLLQDAFQNVKESTIIRRSSHGHIFTIIIANVCYCSIVASGDDTCASGSGKGSRKEYGSAAPSPSPGHSSLHDDYEGAPSPWPRPPSSPVSYNSEHLTQL